MFARWIKMLKDSVLAFNVTHWCWMRWTDLRIAAWGARRVHRANERRCATTLSMRLAAASTCMDVVSTAKMTDVQSPVTEKPESPSAGSPTASGLPSAACPAHSQPPVAAADEAIAFSCCCSTLVILYHRPSYMLHFIAWYSKSRRPRSGLY